MLLRTIEDAHNYKHIFVAPHLDDAALSCGGQIAQLRAADECVLAVTLCAGSPPADAALTPFAAYLHQEWALGDDPIARRRDEDVRALALLGCDGLHLDQLDAPYRVPAYGIGDGWRGQVVADDPLMSASIAILTQLHLQQPHARLYLPLGVGNHVDHQVVCGAGFSLAARGADVIWYEDAPYAAKQPESIRRRLTALPIDMESIAVDITAFLKQKLEAITVYQSQLRELFGDQPMEQEMTRYAAEVAPNPGLFGERLWRPANDVQP
jgi:LmbE family N-acetylglucosaminyl deacetylase